MEISNELIPFSHKKYKEIKREEATKERKSKQIRNLQKQITVKCLKLN